jgi:hypothetical protein
MTNTIFWLKKSKGKRKLGRPRRIWKDNIKTDLREKKRWKGVFWIYLTQDRDWCEAL